MSEWDTLSEAIETGDTAQARRLLAADPTLATARNENNVSLLLQAVYYGRGEIVNAFLATGLSLDLWEAVALGHTERVVQILGQDPDQVNNRSADGFPPLGLAAFFGHPETMRVLLAHDADPDIPAENPTQVRPIHSAVAHRQAEVALEMTELLLATGAEVNVAQQGGWTPLHQAAHHGQTALVERLLAHGADPQERSDDGRRPADMARENGFSELAQRLAA
ncbi:MAG: ankyrin repeat domain-containing protein [Candidatus Promineifilaceae bacterium]|nr:ankyrin repeat domain-containing protein [Candidatus Promineifilaceae bacterium]